MNETPKLDPGYECYIRSLKTSVIQDLEDRGDIVRDADKDSADRRLITKEQARELHDWIDLYAC